MISIFSRSARPPRLIPSGPTGAPAPSPSSEPLSSPEPAKRTQFPDGKLRRRSQRGDTRSSGSKRVSRSTAADKTRTRNCVHFSDEGEVDQRRMRTITDPRRTADPSASRSAHRIGLNARRSPPPPSSPRGGSSCPHTHPHAKRQSRLRRRSARRQDQNPEKTGPPLAAPRRTRKTPLPRRRSPGRRNPMRPRPQGSGRPRRSLVASATTRRRRTSQQTASSSPSGFAAGFPPHAVTPALVTLAGPSPYRTPSFALTAATRTKLRVTRSAQDPNLPTWTICQPAS